MVRINIFYFDDPGKTEFVLERATAEKKKSRKPKNGICSKIHYARTEQGEGLAIEGIEARSKEEAVAAIDRFLQEIGLVSPGSKQESGTICN